MGIYVNPEGMTKEEWLAENGIPVIEAPGYCGAGGDGWLPVCLVDNGWMTAAAVAYNDRELEDFADTSDPRPKQWFWVEIEKLYLVSDLEKVLPV